MVEDIVLRRIILAIVVLLSVGLLAAPPLRHWMVGHDAAYFQNHPDDLRDVLNECRAEVGWALECAEAEAVATY